MKKTAINLLLILGTSVMFSQSFQWAKRGGSSDALTVDSNYNRKEEVYSMVTDSNKNIYILSSVGKTTLNIDGFPKTGFGSSINPADVILASFACDGSYRWSKVFFWGGNENIQNLQIDAQNNIYVAGTFGACGSSHSYDFPPCIDDDFNMLQPGSEDCSKSFITKFNSEGVMQWLKRPQASGPNSTAYSYGLAVDSAGTSYWLTLLGPGTYGDGAFVNTLTGYNYFLLKYNNAGTFISATLMDMQLGGTAGNYLKMYYNPNNGNLYFTGRRYAETQTVVLGGQTVTKNIYITSFNTQGQFLWKTEDSSTVAQGYGLYAFDLDFDAQNNIYIGGSMIGLNLESFLGYSFPEQVVAGFVMKTNPTCSTLLWANHSNKSVSGLGGVAVSGNEVGFTSWSSGTLVWGTQSLYFSGPNEGTDVMFARFNKDTGACLSLSKISGDVGYDDSGTALAVDASGDYIIGGNFGHQLLVNGTTTLLNNGPQTDFFVAKYATEVCSPLGVANHEKKAVAVYPNPTSGIVHLSISDDMSYTLYTITGTVVNKGKVSAQNNTIDVSNLPSGVYMLQLQDGDGVVSLVKVLRE